ncbi:MAG: PAS domain S-box protein [Pirellulales bacterium]|nr:PAS domain S-box protein [Pirellulales bacterium]
MTNDLVQVLRKNASEIRDAFAERVGRLECACVGQDDQSIDAIIEAVIKVATDGDQVAARRWLQQNGDRSEGCRGTLSVLGCLERIMRFFVLRELDQKRSMLTSLNQLADAVDIFRCVAAELSSGKDIASRTTTTSQDGPWHKALAALTEQSSDCICLTDLQGKPFYLNALGRRLVGMPQGSGMKGMPTSLKEYHELEFWGELRDTALPTVRKKGRWKGRGQLRIAGSEDRIDVEATVLLVSDNVNGDANVEKPICLAIVYRDCGRLLKVERDLEESRARKTAILESSLDPIITIDHSGMITEFNRAAEQVFGRSRTEVLGTQPSEILFPAAKIAGYQNRIDRYLDAGEGSLLSKRNEVIAVRSSGLPFEAELTMTINQEHGNPVLTFFVRDISKRKRAEEEQRRHAQELEQSNRELEQFAYVASHDLQEPLRKIRTFGDRLMMSYGDAMDDTGRECLGRMQNAATRMQDLIKGLLSLSRITTRAAEFAPVDLGKVAREVVSDLEVKIEQTGARIEVGKLPTIQADALQMRQLLQNLIGNALKFHRKDVPPVVEIDASLVRDKQNRPVSGLRSNEQCRLVVRDNGIGFDEKYLDRIFDVFQRLHPRDVHEGTGIGLAICRKIVERHGGKITAQSAPDQGAKFVVLLPMIQEGGGEK